MEVREVRSEGKEEKEEHPDIGDSTCKGPVAGGITVSLEGGQGRLEQREDRKAESSKVGWRRSGPVKEHWGDTRDLKHGRHIYLGS